MDTTAQNSPVVPTGPVPKVSPLTGTPVPRNPRGRPLHSSNLHSKHPSSIALRLKKAGVDWVTDLANAIKADNETRINVWLKMLPYLVVTQNFKTVKRNKARASKAALDALSALEGR